MIVNPGALLVQMPPRVMVCHWFGVDVAGSAEYWHMGETRMRLGRVRERMVRGVYSRGGLGEVARPF